MKKKLILAALFTLSLTASANAGPMEYGCDTASGRFSAIELELPSVGLQVAGKIKAVELRKDPNWLPAANVRISSIDGQQSAAVRMTAENAKAKVTNAYLEGEVDGSARQGSPQSVALGAETPFSLKVATPKEVVLMIGSQTARLPVVLGDKVKLSITCSTGDFIFSELVWSNTP